MGWLESLGHYPLGALIASHTETLLWKAWDESRKEKRRGKSLAAVGDGEADRFLRESASLEDLAFNHLDSREARHRLFLKSWVQAVKAASASSSSSSSSSSSLDISIKDLKRLYAGMATVSLCHAQSQRCIVDNIPNSQGALCKPPPDVSWLDDPQAFTELVCTTPLPLVGTIHSDVRSRLMAILQEIKATVFQNQLLMSLLDDNAQGPLPINSQGKKAKKKKKKRPTPKQDPTEPPPSTNAEEMMPVEPEEGVGECEYGEGEEVFVKGEGQPLPVLEEADEEDYESSSVERQDAASDGEAQLLEHGGEVAADQASPCEDSAHGTAAGFSKAPDQDEIGSVGANSR